MQIRYAVTKHKREVPESIGRRLVAARIATEVRDPVYQTAAVKAEEPGAEEAEISPRTGKPKRQYKRRDLRSES